MFVLLSQDLSAEELKTFGLVLAAADIEHHIRHAPDGWQILVEADAVARATELLQAYQRENRIEATPGPTPELPHRRTYSGVWVALLLLGCYGAISLWGDPAWMIARFGASAGHILQGEIYRTVTALLLHRDVVHLAGNMLGIAVLGTAVGSTCGWGVGWLLVLLAGLTGNGFNALLYQSRHLAIGASTAVFGAIGILGAIQFWGKWRLPGQRLRALLPLGAGIALLGFLGAGQHADLMGHLFGLIAGIGFGLGYAVMVRHPLDRMRQGLALTLAIGLVGIAWAWGWP